VAEAQLALVRASAALWVAAFRLMAPPRRPRDPGAKVVSLAAYRRARAVRHPGEVEYRSVTKISDCFTVARRDGAASVERRGLRHGRSLD
jgi:hypothetical protein